MPSEFKDLNTVSDFKAAIRKWKPNITCLGLIIDAGVECGFFSCGFLVEGFSLSGRLVLVFLKCFIFIFIFLIFKFDFK